MFDAPPQTTEPSAPQPQTAARERMGLLRRFAEIGLRIAERIDRQSESAAVVAESPLFDKDAHDAAVQRQDQCARSFARVSRAASVALALEDRIERAPRLDNPPFGPELVCTVPRQSALSARREEVEHGVRKAIDLSTQAQPRLDADRLCRELDAMLDREMAAVDAFLCRPADVIVTRLCERLGINPDWAFMEPREENPSPVRGGMGPVAQQREGGVTDLRRQHNIRRDAAPKPAPQSLNAKTVVRLSAHRSANTPSSHSASPNGAHPSPDRGRVASTAHPDSS